MGRPRNSSNAMNPSRLLKNGSAATMTLMNLHLPAVAHSQMPRTLEEDLESQARASISLFGFGSGEGGGVSWSRVPVNAGSFDAMSSMGMGGGGSSGSVSTQSLLLMERVCPVGTNPTLWNTMHNGETINQVTGTSNSLTSEPTLSESSSSNVSVDYGDDDGDVEGSGSNSYLFGSKVLQQYLVKGVALLPASLEEVIELLVRSDGDDMETAMHHLAGIKTSASGLIYRRRKKRLRRRHLPSGGSTGSGSGIVGKSLSSTALTYDSDSSSSSSDEEDRPDHDENDENQLYSQFNRVSLHTAPPPRPSRKTRTPNPNRERVSLTAMDRTASNGYMDDYYQSLMAETGNRGNLSLKWVVGERPGRVFTTRVHLCLLDYECIIINDWDDTEENKAPMYVRAIQSCYLPQCQPWMDEFGSSRPSDLQPTGFMVRESKHREGYVEVQFVGAVLEKAQLPNASRRAKLRSLVARIAKLEEVITSRRLSQSLLAHQPLWVRNNERSTCYCCDAKFNTISRRRHHCRMCGEVCCSDCSPKMDVALPDVGVTSVRVCVSCLRKRRQSTDFVSGSISSMSSMGSMSSFYMPGMPSPRRGPAIMTPPTPPLAPPPPITPHLSSSSSSEYLSSSSYGSLSSNHGGIMGERKQSTGLLQRFKSG